MRHLLGCTTSCTSRCVLWAKWSNKSNETERHLFSTFAHVYIRFQTLRIKTSSRRSLSSGIHSLLHNNSQKIESAEFQASPTIATAHNNNKLQYSKTNMGFNGIIWWRKKPQKKKKKKSKPKKVKVFWHKDPISIDSSEESREILDTSLTDEAFKLCSLKDPPSSYKRASTSTTFGTSSTTTLLDNTPVSPADTSSCIYCGVHYNTELSLLSHVRSSVLNFDVDIDGIGEDNIFDPGVMSYMPLIHFVSHDIGWYVYLCLLLGLVFVGVFIVGGV